MKNVLFVAPTTYQIPLTENIEKKFKYLSEICNLHIFAFSNEKNYLTIGDTKLYLYKKVKNISNTNGEEFNIPAALIHRRA